MIKKFSRIIASSQSNYNFSITKKENNKKQCSYNLPIDLEDYLLKLEAIYIDFEDNKPQNNGKYIKYKLVDDYKMELGPNIIAVIGVEFININNNVVFTHTEGKNGSSKKIQLKKTDFSNEKDITYSWFSKLYEKNIENIDFVVYVDDENKNLKFDLELTKEMFSSVENGTDINDCQYDFSVDEQGYTLNEDPSFDYSVSLPNRNSRTNKKYPLNMILYGAPGTGKTYSTINYSMAIIENCDISNLENCDRKTLMNKYKKMVEAGRIVFTTFHQSYGYEDFIQGLRPDSDAGALIVKPCDGVFKKIADKAMYDFDNDYVIIIDEINRANISKVFGELITLLEEDKRWGELNELSVKLPSKETFAIPNNLYIIGTMNTADKSISLIDIALRRRFEFIEQTINYGAIKNDVCRDFLISLNKKIIEELESTDLLIGHAYFINKSEEDLLKVINQNIVPLLYEYFFDNTKKVRHVLDKALECTKLKLIDNEFSRVTVDKK